MLMPGLPYRIGSPGCQGFQVAPTDVRVVTLLKGRTEMTCPQERYHIL